jgi:transcriptional regulator with XRE-family HTH domain
MTGNRIKELRKMRRMTLEDLAEKVELSTGYVQRLENGDRNLSTKHFSKFAKALGVGSQDLVLADPADGHIDSSDVDLHHDHLGSEALAAGLDGPEKRTIKIKGYVGAGAEAHFYKYADEDFEIVEPPAGASDQTIAVQIKGRSWGPRMDGWLVFYDDVRSPITEDMYNQPCVVGLADDRILLKTIKRERDGSFTLQSNSDEPDIENVEIEWAAKVIGMRPRQ